MTHGPRKIVVIGGGISGLAAAHRLVELDPAARVFLLESGNRLGGVLQTESREGFLLEQSADMFTTKDSWALDLCRRIGFERELIQTNEALRRAMVVRNGRLVPVPAGFTLMSPTRIWPILSTPLLTWRGKVRLAWECAVPVRNEQTDESLAAFTRRRMGNETYERLVQPMIGGIYTADPERLSMQATMNQFVELERQYGSVIRGMRSNAQRAQKADQSSGARYGLFMAPREGMASLVSALASRLPPDTIQLNTPVQSLQKLSSGGWRIRTDGDTQTADGVILALPARPSAALLSPGSRSLADHLQRIESASATIVILGYARSQIAHPLDGFGFVVPLAERRKILACSFSSVKFAGRAPDNHVLLRVFVGGACQPELVDLDDDATLQLVTSELQQLIGASGKPKLVSIVRWRDSMPQYHVGHRELVRNVEQLATDVPDFELAGNAYAGVGIPLCVRSGEQAAQRMVDSQKCGRSS